MVDIKGYIIIGLILFGVVGFIVTMAYLRGVWDTTDKYERIIREKELEVQQRMHDMQHEQNIEVKQFLIRVAELEEQHQEDMELLKNAEFKDAIIAPSVPVADCRDRVQPNKGNSGRVQKTGAESDLVCYTREELQRKVERSLAITNEADKLVEQYKALLEICGKE
jgi:hypothetical protein